MQATILTGRNNIFTAVAADAVYLCRLRGKTLELDERSYNPLAPGDEVELAAMDPTHRTAIIERRLPRRTAFGRYNRKRDAVQTLAANIDAVLVVASVEDPPFRDQFVDRALALAEFYGLSGIIAVSKADLAPERAAELCDRYRLIGYAGLVTRADEGSSLDNLRRELAGRRTVLDGQSGVGKSTVLNALSGAAERTGAISARHRTGRHTTNAAVLVRTAGLEIVDTPGIREIDCRHVPAGMVEHLYRELRRYHGRCTLVDCLHTDEPGCAVREAAESGGIDAERYRSYLRLYRELAETQGEHQ